MKNQTSTDSSASESLDGALVTWNGVVADFGVLSFERYDDELEEAIYSVLWARDGFCTGTHERSWEVPALSNGSPLHTIVIR